MKTRLLKNWITSCFGCVLFLVSMYLYATSKITAESVIALLPAIALLLRSKDSLLWAKPKDS